MDNITMQTRREAYDAVMPEAKKRALLVLETLGDREMTVSEITEELTDKGVIPYFNRNYVAPRMTELRDFGLVEAVGKRMATRSDRAEAVWRRTERR